MTNKKNQQKTLDLHLYNLFPVQPVFTTKYIHTTLTSLVNWWTKAMFYSTSSKS